MKDSPNCELHAQRLENMEKEITSLKESFNNVLLKLEDIQSCIFDQKTKNILLTKIVDDTNEMLSQVSDSISKLNKSVYRLLDLSSDISKCQDDIEDLDKELCSLTEGAVITKEKILNIEESFSKLESRWWVVLGFMVTQLCGLLFLFLNLHIK